MKNRTLVTLILTLALAAANAAPLSALVTCGMADAPGGCSCAHDACCPEEAPAGPAFGSTCCTVTLPDVKPVDMAPAPPAPGEAADAASPAVAVPGPALTPDPSLPAPPATVSPPPSAPPYRLHCAYLI